MLDGPLSYLLSPRSLNCKKRPNFHPNSSDDDIILLDGPPAISAAVLETTSHGTDIACGVYGDELRHPFLERYGQFLCLLTLVLMLRVFF